MHPPRPSWAASFRARAVIALLAALAALSGACAQGLSHAPGIHRQWTPEDFQHDVISNGPESCPKEGQPDPLAPGGRPARRGCPESSDPAPSAPSAR